MAESDPALSRPLSVEQIVEIAQSFDYNPLIPLKYWLRTATTLLKEADIYEREGNEQQTYLLLFRHAQLVLRNIGTHPDSRQPQNRKNLVSAMQAVEPNLAKLEVLKPRLNSRYQRYEQIRRDRGNTKVSNTVSGVGNPHALEGVSNQVDDDFDPGMQTLTARKNGDLAVKLAHREIRRRATARESSRWPARSVDEKQETRRTGLGRDWKNNPGENAPALDQYDLSEHMQKVRSQVNCEGNDRKKNEASLPLPEHRTLTYRYPTVPEQKLYKPKVSRKEDSSNLSSLQRAFERAPEPPPKNRERSMGSGTVDPLGQQGDVPKHELPHGFATINRSEEDFESTTFTFKPSAYLENGSPLRTIFLPPDLRLRFLALALPNTQANLETCGILCGTLISNALFISKLVIPDQKSTSDTCETVNEDKLFDFVDGEDLMVLGWIHTHPTQTCFMSSRDLHTHSGYQAMMSESIAIVCAPSKGDWGAFRLTDPPGMKAVLSCMQKGLFHPHSESDLYTDALRPGHTYEAKGLEFDIVDLRPAI